MIPSCVAKYPSLFFLFLCAVLFAPFSGKPFHVDSTVTVHVAQQLLIDPVNPPIGDYGKICAVWNRTELPETSAYHLTPHPPLIPLYLAPWIALFGENEIILNWAMFPFYIISVLFFFRLCTLLVPRWRFEATLLFLASPAVLVNAGNVMLDVPLMCFCLGSFYYLFRSKHFGDVLVSGLFAGLACLTKFTGGTVVIAGIFFLLQEKKWKMAVLYLAPAAILYGVWMLHNIALWGTIQLVANGHAHYLIGDMRYRMERLVSFLGGAMVFPLFILVPALFAPRYRISAIVALVLSLMWAVLLVWKLDYSLPAALFYALCASSGVLLVGGIMMHARDSAPWKSLSLHALLQIMGGLFLTLYAVRYLLPFAFVALLVLTAGMSALPVAWPKRVLWYAMILCSAVISILLSIGDYQLAGAEKRIAEAMTQQYPGTRVYYAGRMGYLHYMDKAGFMSLLGHHRDSIMPGDLMIRNTAFNDDSRFFHDTSHLSLVREIRFPLPVLRTMTGRAGFYGNDRLPYALVSHPHDRVFEVYRYAP